MIFTKFDTLLGDASDTYTDILNQKTLHVDKISVQFINPAASSNSITIRLKGFIADNTDNPVHIEEKILAPGETKTVHLTQILFHNIIASVKRTSSGQAAGYILEYALMGKR